MEERFERTLEELESHACMWWPREVRDVVNEMSIMKVLLETQGQFISLLCLTKPENPESVFDLIEASNISLKLFLKHLIVLTDFGAEQLQRINKYFENIFPGGELTYQLPGYPPATYKLHSLPCKGALSNEKMKIDTIDNIVSEKQNKVLLKDVAMILLVGAASVNRNAANIFFKCTPYTYLGDKDKIEHYVKSNYIRVSRIIAGKTANDLGNVAQQYSLNYISKQLGDNYNIHSNGTIPGVTENDGITLSTFDIVVDRKGDESRHKPYVGIEVSFQETTNSVIERKATLARNRFEKVSSRRSYVAYILDGAGNFSRHSAAKLICDNSHCTVAYTEEEFDVLVKFIKEKLG